MPRSVIQDTRMDPILRVFFQDLNYFSKVYKGWVLLAQFDPSGNRRQQPKTDGNTEITAGNTPVAAGNTPVAAGNREKAFNKFVYYNV